MRKDRRPILITQTEESIYLFVKGKLLEYPISEAKTVGRLVCRLLWTGEYSLTQKDSNVLRKAYSAQGSHWVHPDHYFVER